MKLRILDQITRYQPGGGIAVVHTVSLEETLQARKIGQPALPGLLIMLAAEAAGYFFAAESDFLEWAVPSELAGMRLEALPSQQCWQLSLRKLDDRTMSCSGALSGEIKFEKIKLADCYSPEERRSLFHALRKD